jgi:hypothetical protein
MLGRIYPETKRVGCLAGGDKPRWVGTRELSLRFLGLIKSAGVVERKMEPNAQNNCYLSNYCIHYWGYGKRGNKRNKDNAQRLDNS